MRTLKEVKKRLEQYEGAKYIYTDYGFIAWQCSTGENYELLFIEVAKQRLGYGRKLIKEMCKNIKPYHSVFVVRMRDNKVAGKFYRKLGFKEHIIKGLYKNKDAVLGTVSYETLCQNL